MSPACLRPLLQRGSLRWGPSRFVTHYGYMGQLTRFNSWRLSR